MRTPSYLGYVISGASALALLAGCSGGGSLAPAGTAGGSTLQSISSPHMLQHKNYSILPASHADWLLRPAHKTTPFVNVAGITGPNGNQVMISDFNNSTVTVFGGAGQVNAVLTAGLLNPQGMATDTSGNLWVADTGNSNILVFPKPYSGATTTLNDSGYYPTDVSLDPSTGNVAAMNIFALSGGPGNVVIFAKGSTTPCATVGSSSVSAVYFGAYDASGNLFIDGHDNNGNTFVGEVTGGCSATGITLLSTGNFINFPGGIQVTKAGNILIDDQLGAAVYTYAPPSGGSLGSPTATTFLSGSSDPVTFAIKSADQNLWTADAGLLSANKYAYPAGGSPSKSFFSSNFSLPIGSAVNPAQIP